MAAPRSCLYALTARLGALVWGLALALVLALAPAGSGHAAPSDPPRIRVGVPEGFDALLERQKAVVDLWFGGRRVGEALAEFGAGELRFADPAAVVARLPDVADKAAVLAALAAPGLADNRHLACRGDTQRGCGALRPDIAGIIFDPDRFRVDVFVNPRLLTVRAARARDFLPPPPGGLSLLNAMGFTLAGTTARSAQHTVTDRLVLGLGNARLRAGLSHSSELGWRADTLSAEIDGRGMRYAGGVLWAPGDDLVGRRRILGAGITSQFDTRLDRDQIEGTALVVFLDTRSRVDILVDGRLAASGLYEAGNQALDTGGLPEGSYSVVLRIVGAGGAVRTERRQFSRTRRLPPAGSDAWHLHAGAMLDDGAGGLIGRVTATPLVQAGWARRLAPGVGISVGAMASSGRQLAQLGAVVLARGVQLEASTLFSARGDVGLVGRASTRGGGRLAFDVEGRLVNSRDGGPLLPEPRYRPIFLDQAASFQPVGSYGQVTGSLSWQAGGKRVALAGTWRRRGDYAVGPSFRVPLLRRSGFELVARGDYAFTPRGRSGFIGLSLNLTGRRAGFYAEGGLREVRAGGSGAVRPMGLVRGTIQHENAQGRQVQASAALGRDDGAAYAMAEGMAAGRLGEMAGSILQPLGGQSGQSGLQYAFSMRTGMAATGAGLRFGVNPGEAAVVAAVRGAEPDDRFEVLVNDVALGTITGAGKAMIALPAYRAYDVRIRATGAGMTRHDTAARRVTLYPGTVAGLRWDAARALAVTGRLIDPAGAPLAGADLVSGSNIAQTNAHGTFLIELDAGRTIAARLPDGRSCRVTVAPAAPARNGFAALGSVACQVPPVRPAPVESDSTIPLATAPATH